jgi:phage-related holin
MANDEGPHLTMKEFLPCIRLFLAKLFIDQAIFKAISAACIAVATYLDPHGTVAPPALGATTLVLIDTLTGLVAARLTHQQITSARFSRVLVKLFGYSAVVVTASITFREVSGMQSFRDAAVSGVITLVLITEAISILENCRKMGLQLPSWIEQALAGRQAQLEQQAPPEPWKDPHMGAVMLPPTEKK